MTDSHLTRESCPTISVRMLINHIRLRILTAKSDTRRSAQSVSEAGHPVEIDETIRLGEKTKASNGKRSVEMTMCREIVTLGYSVATETTTSLARDLVRRGETGRLRAIMTRPREATASRSEKSLPKRKRRR